MATTYREETRTDAQGQPYTVRLSNDTINSDTLANTQTPITVPTYLAGSSVPPPPAPTQNQDNSAINAYLNGSSAPKSMESQYATDYANAGINDLQGGVNTANNAVTQEQANLSAINAKLNALSASGTQAQLQLESGASGKDVTSTFLGRQQQEVSRQAGIQALPLQAQALASQAKIQALQGNAQAAQTLLTQAQEHVDKLFQIQSTDAQNEYNYKQKLLDTVYDYATKQEQKKLDEQKTKNEQDFQLKRDEAARQQAVSMENLNYQHQLGVAGYANSLKQTNPGGVDANGNPVANQAQLGVINDVNTIINDPSFTSSFGWGNILKRNMPGSAEYNVKQLTGNLIDKLALAARGQLKGQGTVSDYEGKMLKNAQTALKFNMDPAQAMQQLINVRGAIATSSGLTATVEVKDLATGQSQILTSDQAGINKAIQDGLLVTYK